MVIKNKKILFFALLMCFLSSLWAQENEPVTVERTKNKIVLDGKVYYVHVVKSGETIYSISQAYNISQKELVSLNPEIAMGLKEGHVLKIPEMPRKIEETEIIKSDKYIYHIVKPGQTLYYISREYNIPINKIIEINPELEISSLQVDQVIKIPKNQGKNKDAPARKDTVGYIKHEVKKGETLYSLAKQYDVSVHEIQVANEDLSIHGMETGRIIKIPVKKQAAIYTTPPRTDTIKIDTFPSVQPGKVDAPTLCDTLEFNHETKTFNVALILPLMLDHGMSEYANTLESNNQDVDDVSITRARKNMIAKISPFMEFYEGLLLAVDKLKKDNLNINLYVYDSGYKGTNTGKIIKNYNFYRMDLIIGPFYDANIGIVADFAKENEILMVAPIANDRENIAYNPFLFQVVPSTGTELEQAARFITKKSKDNIVILHEGDIRSIDIKEKLMRKLLNQLSLQHAFDSSVVKELVMNDSTNLKIEDALVKDKLNIVMIPSNEEGFVAEIIRRLYSLSKNYSIKILGMPSWQKFKSIETNYLHAVNMGYYTPFYIDYHDEQVNEFINMFHDIYGYVPYKITNKGFNYAFLGHDIMMYFMLAMKEYGPSAQECIHNFSAELLMGTFSFNAFYPTDGNENKYISIVEYGDNYTVKVTDSLTAPPDRSLERIDILPVPTKKVPEVDDLILEEGEEEDR